MTLELVSYLIQARHHRAPSHSVAAVVVAAAAAVFELEPGWIGSSRPFLAPVRLLASQLLIEVVGVGLVLD